MFHNRGMKTRHRTRVGKIRLKAGSRGQSSPDRELFSCPMPQRQPRVVNLNGARRYRRLVQSIIVATRPPLILRTLHQPFAHGIQLFRQAVPLPSREEPTVRTALTVALSQSVTYKDRPMTAAEKARQQAVKASRNKTRGASR
jgi:hypothetical protein